MGFLARGGFADECGNDAVLSQAVAATAWGDLASAVGAENGQTGESLAQQREVAVVATVKVGAATDAGEHQRARRGGFGAASGDQSVEHISHVGFG